MTKPRHMLTIEVDLGVNFLLKVQLDLDDGAMTNVPGIEATIKATLGLEMPRGAKAVDSFSELLDYFVKAVMGVTKKNLGSPFPYTITLRSRRLAIELTQTTV